MIFGTVISADWLPRAILMAKSIKKNMPYSKVIIGIMEETMPNDIAQCLYFDEAILMKDVGNYLNMKKFFFQYTVQEAVRACKASLLTYIYKKYTEEQSMVYLDANTRVMSPFEELSVISNQHPITLIGKAMNPEFLDLDELTDVRQNGVYDSSFIAIKRHPVAERFLKWWLKISENSCYYDHAYKGFTDQGWLDLSHTLFDDVYSLRNPGYQVSPGNIMERWNITRTAANIFLIDNQPLRSLIVSDDFVQAVSWLDSEKGQFYCELLHACDSGNEEIDKYARDSTAWSYSLFTSGETISDQAKEKFRKHYYDNPEIANPFLLSNAYFNVEEININIEANSYPIQQFRSNSVSLKRRSRPTKKRSIGRKHGKPIRKRRSRLIM